MPRCGRFPDLGGRFPVLHCRSEISTIFQQLRIVHVAVAQPVRRFELAEHVNRLMEVIVRRFKVAQPFVQLPDCRM